MAKKTLFWNRIAGLYDFFELAYNKKVYVNTGKAVAEYIQKTDRVLECACGTGAISLWIAGACKTLVATDYATRPGRNAALFQTRVLRKRTLQS